MSIVNDDNSDIFNLFAVPLGCYNMDFKFSKDELEFLQNQEFDKNEGNLTSKDDFILEREQLKRVRKWIDDCIVHYFDKTYCFVKNELYTTQSWTNLSKPGMFHHRHNHGNSLVSGVMYIEGNDDDKIVFAHEPHLTRNGVFQFDGDYGKVTDYNSSTYWMPATVGRMYLFPSQTKHEVPKVEGTKDRHSLAFNVFLRSKGFSKGLSANVSSEMGDKLNKTFISFDETDWPSTSS